MAKKDQRITVRVSKEDKRQFYKLCDAHGLCPSKIIERWIHRFNLNAKRTSMFIGVVKSAHDEQWEEYNEYHGLKE